MGFPVLESVKKNVPDIFMDCHMMVADPAKVGARRGAPSGAQGGLR